MYQELCAWDNLLLAYRKAARGKRGQPNVAAFEYRLEDNLLQLRRELLAESYRPGPYTSFYIHDPKKRLISAAPFRDRVVHHALVNLIEPLFERSFIFDSYANRIGKGTHRALDRAQAFSRRYRYVLSCDIQQYFPSIDHAILRQILARKIADKRVLGLLDHILASGVGVLAKEYEMEYYPGDDLFAALRPRGLPIGNLTSQFWANCYLNPLDHFVKRQLRCRGYVRYVDDLLLFADDRATLRVWRRELILRLAQLRLSLHERAANAHPCAEGVSFLGFITFPTHRRLKARKGFQFRRRLVALISAFQKKEIPLEKLNDSVRGWINHVRYANTWGLRGAVFAGANIHSAQKEK